jgi:hypothetical protein
MKWVQKEDQTILMELDRDEFSKMVNEYLSILPSDELRKDFMDKINVCPYCGSLDLPCFCTRDD